MLRGDADERLVLGSARELFVCDHSGTNDASVVLHIVEIRRAVVGPVEVSDHPGQLDLVEDLPVDRRRSGYLSGPALERRANGYNRVDEGRRRVCGLVDRVRGGVVLGSRGAVECGLALLADRTLDQP